ncbi:hypothetical protein [Chitinophaga sp. Cy-1792]|uniref:hypothetical protein n=1 Tax=Chitinophaga sp. Cy-1792 TaxID=2608339 RepID=UPI0014239279|nr:hypothetical protein [Chitinophaga sp. Cy-1792]NIG54518.1 hypothetical protein [Chitinophaga sp. Cy-1792]
MQIIYRTLGQIYDSINPNWSMFHPSFLNEIKAKKQSNEKTIELLYNVTKNQDKDLFETVAASAHIRTYALNKSDSKEPIVWKQSINKLPKIPDTENVDNAQYFNLAKGTIAYISTDSLTSAITNDNTNIAAAPENEYALSANNNDGLWAFNLNPHQKKLLFDSIARQHPELLSKIGAYNNYIDEGEIVIPKEDTLQTTAKMSIVVDNTFTLHDTLAQKLSNVADSCFRKFYVLDLFNTGDSCAHGQKVLNVISLILNKHITSAPLRQQLQEKIIAIPLNYTGNKRFLDSLLVEYLKLYNEGDEAKFLMEIKDIPDRLLDYRRIQQEVVRLKASHQKFKPTFICTFVLKALLDYCQRPSSQVDVVNTSLFTKISDRIGLNFTPLSTCFIAAADNSSGSIENLQLLQEGLNNTEPLVTYNTLQHQASSCFLIGGYLSPTKPFGMYSENALGITGVGHASNWNTSNSNSYCITQSTTGNSYASPEVSAMIWLARAYWRSIGITPSPWEIRIKLILSGEIAEDFVQKYASGGLVNWNAFYYPGFRYLMKQDGSIQQLDLSDNSSVTISGTQYTLGKKPTTQKADKLAHKTNILGFKHVNGKNYFLFDDSMCWQEVADQPYFDLKPKGGTAINWDAFIAGYKEIIYY